MVDFDVSLVVEKLGFPTKECLYVRKNVIYMRTPDGEVVSLGPKMSKLMFEETLKWPQLRHLPRDHGALLLCNRVLTLGLRSLLDNKLAMEVPDAILRRSVDTLNVSSRTFDAFHVLGVETLGCVLDHTEADFMELPNFGLRSLKELRSALRLHGLTLNVR